MISIMGLSCWTAGFVSQQTIADGKGVMYVSVAMLIQVTAHPIPSPPTNINLQVTESTAIHYHPNVLSYNHTFILPTCNVSCKRRNKIQFSADILFVFCEWVTYSGSSSPPSGAAHFIFHSLTFEITIENLCCIVKLKT